MKRHIFGAITLCAVIAGAIAIRQGIVDEITANTASVEIVREVQDRTEIYIINGDHEDTGWFAGPSKSEFLKALYDYPQHLFITPSLWKSFCYHRNEQMKELKKEKINKPFEQLKIENTAVYHIDKPKKEYSQNDPEFFNIATILAFDENEWEFYDTHIGLYYLRPKDDVQEIGLPIQHFTKIDHPCNMQVPIEQKPWTNSFINLFDVKEWHNTHKDEKTKIFCISGHGTPSRHPVKRACGIPAEDFAQLVTFFNDILKVDIIGVQTCFWPAKRILELMAENGKTSLNCKLITPIDKEEEVHYRSEMPLVWSYEPESRDTLIKEAFDGELLFTSLHDIATSFKGTVTEDLEKTLDSIQVVQVNHEYNLKTSLVDAQSTEPVFV